MSLEYLIPKSLGEAVHFFDQDNETSFFLAGGTEINNPDFPSPVTRLISLGSLPLKEIRRDKNLLRIGALATLQEILENPLTPPILKQGISGMANRNIRNIATLGGNLGARKSCSSTLPSLFVLKASLEIAVEKNVVTLPLEEYIRDERRELITAVLLDLNSLTKYRFFYRKYSRTANDIAVVSVAVRYSASNPYREILIACGGLDSTVIRLPATEEYLSGLTRPPTEEDLLSFIKKDGKARDDHRGSADFKTWIASALLREALL